MARKNLPKFTLSFDDDKSNWALTNDMTDRTIRRFDTKIEATHRGVLKKAVGLDGGSVKIQKTTGKYQEERTYPKNQGPPQSKG